MSNVRFRSAACAMILASSTSWGSPSSTYESKDVREGCRSNLAGIYMDIYSAKSEADTLLTHLKKQQDELQKRLVKEEADLDKLRKKVTGIEFDPSIQDQMIAMKSQIKYLREDLTVQNAEMIKTTGLKTADLTGMLQGLDKQYQKVFILKISDFSREAKNGKYTIEMTYKHSCNEYMQLCPLPQNQVAGLKDIIAHIHKNLPDSFLASFCERYASILPRKAPHKTASDVKD